MPPLSFPHWNLTVVKVIHSSWLPSVVIAVFIILHQPFRSSLRVASLSSCHLRSNCVLFLFSPPPTPFFCVCIGVWGGQESFCLLCLSWPPPPCSAELPPELATVDSGKRWPAGLWSADLGLLASLYPSSDVTCLQTGNICESSISILPST